MFWLAKVVQAWENTLTLALTKPPRFWLAELAAMTTEPKELMEDWISTLEMENMVDCSPAGMPTRMISNILSRCSRSAFRSSR